MSSEYAALIIRDSNLLRVMASKVNVSWEDGSNVLPVELFRKVGDLTFEQLSNLRHRGAFSTVSLTFARFCHLSQHQVSVQFETDILEDYYQVCFVAPKVDMI